jgi:DNA modification methylase
MLLLQGDCLNQMKTLTDKSIDCFVCDLPYGCLSSPAGVNRMKANGEIRTNKAGVISGMGCSWDVKIDLVEFWKQVKRLAKNDHTPVLMFCNTRFGVELINSNPDWFRYDLVWAKTNGVGFLSANKQPLRSHELIYVFSKKGAFYKRVDIQGNFPKPSPSGTGNAGGSVYGKIKQNNDEDRTGIRCVKSVIEISNKKGKGNHPTQKPVELYKWLLERYSNEGDTVLDATAGSFNSVFTAHDLKRNAIGIEKDNTFFYKAVQNSIKRINLTT